MALTVTELADEVRETNRRLTDAIHGLRTEVHDLRTEVAKINTSLNWAKGIGASLFACALGILTFAYRVDQKVTHMEDAVVALQKDSAETKARDKLLADSLAALQKDSKQVLDSLARIEKSKSPQ
jgi:phage shock protein A